MRYMLHPDTERRIVIGALWFIAACILLAMLAACNPYHSANLQNDIATPTAAADILTRVSKSFTPDRLTDVFLLHNVDPFELVLDVTGGKVQP